jgi:hypothetical protein
MQRQYALAHALPARHKGRHFFYEAAGTFLIGLQIIYALQFRLHVEIIERACPFYEWFARERTAGPVGHKDQFTAYFFGKQFL